MSSINSNNTKSVDYNDSDPDESPQNIPYRRDRTPSIVVQSLGLSFNKDSNITESIELPNDDDNDEENEDEQQNNNSQHSSDASDLHSSTSGIEENTQNAPDSPHGSKNSSPQTSSPGLLSSPIRSNLKSLTGATGPTSTNFSARPASPAALGGSNRRLSLNIGSTMNRRQSLTVDGLSSSSASFVNPAYKDSQSSLAGNATGSLRNKVALKPGHSLMGWIKLASTAKNLSGTNGKILEVTPEELAKHDKEEDCWVALKGNVYNVTTYLHYHPGGVEELMRGAGRDATELFNEVHRWVNYESILSKCLIGPYKLDSPLTPIGRSTFANITSDSSSPTSKSVLNSSHINKNQNITSSNMATTRKDPTVAQKPPRRQSIALTVPSPNKYQSLLLNNSLSTNLNQIQQPPTYVIMQDKSCIKIKIQDLTTLPLIRSRHLICDLNENRELHVSVILSTDWLYRVHLRLDQEIDQRFSINFSSDDGSITVILNKKAQAIWNRIGTSLDLNDSLCEMTLADKFFRPCQLTNKKQLTHDVYLFEFSLEDHTFMYVPIGWHVLVREYSPKTSSSSSITSSTDNITHQDHRVHKNYTPVLNNIHDNDGLPDETGFMSRLYFIIKIYPDGLLTSKLDQLEIGDNVEISDYQIVDFDIEQRVKTINHWVLFAAGTGITPFCRIISYLLSRNGEDVKSIHLLFFNKTQKDIILCEEFKQLVEDNKPRFKVTHVLSDEPIKPEVNSKTQWTGKQGRISKDIVAGAVDTCNPDELQLLGCGPRGFTQSLKAIANDLNLQEKLYIFHG